MTLSVRVQPGSSKSGPLGPYGECLKWGVHSAPQDGKANQELIRSLAKFFKLSKSSVEILHGETSRTKLILLKGLTADDIAKLEL